MVAINLILYCLGLVIVIMPVIGQWKLFAKAGKPGWASIIPIYNQIVQLEIAGRPEWWVVLTMFVPFLQIWVYIVAMIDFVRSYQRSGIWVLFIVLVPCLAYPILAFSNKTQYRGPIAAGFNDFMPAPVPTGTSGGTLYQPLIQTFVPPSMPVVAPQPEQVATPPINNQQPPIG